MTWNFPRTIYPVYISSIVQEPINRQYCQKSRPSWTKPTRLSSTITTKTHLINMADSSNLNAQEFDPAVYTIYRQRRELFRYGNGPRMGIWGGRDSLQIAMNEASRRHSFFRPGNIIYLGTYKAKDIGELYQYCESFLLGHRPWEGFSSYGNLDTSEEMDYIHQPGYRALLESANSCFLCFVPLCSLEVITEARRCQGLMHVAMHIVNERCIL